MDVRAEGSGEPRQASTPRRALAEHPLIFGDWTRLVRDGIDVVRLVFLGGAVVSAVTGEWTSAALLGFGFAASLLGRLARLPRPFDLVLVLAIGADIWGDFTSAYKIVPWYDLLVHFLLPLALAPSVYLVLARLGVVPDLAGKTERHQRLGIALITWTIGISIGAIYEMYEYGLVHLMGAQLRIGYADTIGDLIDNAGGALAGALLLVLWAVRGWGTQRRLRGRGLRPLSWRGLMKRDD